MGVVMGLDLEGSCKDSSLLGAQAGERYPIYGIAVQNLLISENSFRPQLMPEKSSTPGSNNLLLTSITSNGKDHTLSTVQSTPKRQHRQVQLLRRSNLNSETSTPYPKV